MRRAASPTSLSNDTAQAGPLLNDEGEMVGSLVILDVEDMKAAQDWANNDPYAKAELFSGVELIPWKKVI